MKQAPAIIVQIVHIHGPLKGKIEEFTDSEIKVGRHPSCQVIFPKDLNIVSRIHARIVREGNRFKLMDQSSNGTFLNGKMVKEGFLKDGDVLMFAQGGPKASFLTQVLSDQPAVESDPVPDEYAIPSKSPVMDRQPLPPLPKKKPQAAAAASIPESPAGKPPQEMDKTPISPREMSSPIPKTQAPLIVQYGPTLRSFKELPITIGSSPSCEFHLDRPGILQQHAQIFFDQGDYWVKDLTGQSMVSINETPIQFQASLPPDSRLSLSPSGPQFRFMGGGRLAEIEEPIAAPSEIAPENEDNAPPGGLGSNQPKSGGSILKKLWRS